MSDLFKPDVQLSVLLIMGEKKLQKSHKMKNKQKSKKHSKSKGWDDAKGCCYTSSTFPSAFPAFSASCLEEHCLSTV